jgi:hypothetical protein
MEMHNQQTQYGPLTLEADGEVVRAAPLAPALEAPFRPPKTAHPEVVFGDTKEDPTHALQS